LKAEVEIVAVKKTPLHPSQGRRLHLMMTTNLVFCTTV